MERFLERHQNRIIGVLSGFDRMLFRGTLRSISHQVGMDMFLSSQGILYKCFGDFVDKLSDRIKEHAEQLAQKAGRPFRYLASAEEPKEEIARGIMKEDDVRDGLVCVLTCVEPCRSFSIRKNASDRRLHLVVEQRKCLHLYFYYVDRDFGLMHIRLQTWAPYPIQVCLNGREYLARQLDKAGIGYEQRDNAFVRIDDLPRAQKLLQRLVTRKWVPVLQALARRHNPLIAAKTGTSLHDYYWTLRQGEWATDVMFKNKKALAEVYPQLVEHATQKFGCRQVLRFLGRRVNCRFNGGVSTELKDRPEGLCVKHWVEENSIKMYDKQESILRIETTINNAKRFKTRRLVTRRGQERLLWAPMRKSVVDIPRLVELSQGANNRYLEALALVLPAELVHRLLDPVSRRVRVKERPYRALRPVSAEDAAVFAVLLNGAFHIGGFRNDQLRAALYPDATDALSQRQASGRVTRHLALWRAHGLIRKVPHTRQYRVTVRGTQIMTTALHLRQLDLRETAA
jgi:hypothetical protein